MAEEAAPVPVNDAEPSAVSANPRLTIDVKVYAPFHVYFEGEAYSISAVNKTGPFDILPRHHNFLCMLVPCTLRIKTPDGKVHDVKISRALMHVKANRVVVFVDV